MTILRRTNVADRSKSPHDLNLMPDWLLVQRIANKYDHGENYGAEWCELVRRVGEEEAERLVDQAP